MAKETINYTNALKAVIQHLEEARTHDRSLQILRALPEYLCAQDARIAKLESLAETLKTEARNHAGEARSANSTINEIYQIISGATGEPANWHGAQPIRDFVESMKTRIAKLTASEEIRKQLESETFEEYDWFYKLKFICRVLGNDGNAPKEDWKTAYGMARSLFDSAWLVQREKAKINEATQWKPIETAPIDGNAILLRVGNIIGSGRYRSKYIHVSVARGFYFDGASLPSGATHWMPLPPL